MAPLIHLDTHLLVWLYLPELDRLSQRARAAINDSELSVSPMATLELTCLHEVGRLRVDAAAILSSLHDQLGLRVDESEFAAVAARAQEQSWTRDPFDRLIAAQSITAGAALLTADEAMREHLDTAIW